MTTEQLWSLIGSTGRGVLVTLKRDGRPQLSNVDYAAAGGRIRISTTADRAKVANLRLDRLPTPVLEQIIVQVHAIKRGARGMNFVEIRQIFVDEMRQGFG